MVGDNIKKLRETLGLTQQKFADRIGIKQNSVALIEGNKRNISRQALLSISREFGVRLDWLRNVRATRHVDYRATGSGI